jgi:hypothetical protein
MVATVRQCAGPRVEPGSLLEGMLTPQRLCSKGNVCIMGPSLLRQATITSLLLQRKRLQVTNNGSEQLNDDFVTSSVY